MGIAPHKIDSSREGLALRLVFSPLHKLAINQILTMGPARIVRVATVCVWSLWIGDLPDPHIALLAAKKLPRAVLRVVGGPARFPIVLVVTHQMRRHATFGKHPRHGGIKRLERTPGSMQKIGPTRVQISTSGHAGHRTHIAIVKRDAALGQALKVRRVHPVTAVGRQHVAIKRIKHHHNGFHGRLLSSCNPAKVE